MGWFSNLFKSKDSEEKDKIENKKIKLRGSIQRLTEFIDELIKDLSVKIDKENDIVFKEPLKRIKSQLQTAKGHLEGADKSLSELNIKLSIEELEEGDREINSKNLSDNAVTSLIGAKKLPKNYLDSVNYLRTNLDRLIRRDLPDFKPES